MEKKRAYIFGSGDLGQRLYYELQNEYEFIGFLDNNAKLWNTVLANEIMVYNPEKVNESAFDVILLAASTGLKEVPEQLIRLGVNRDKIITHHVIVPALGRIQFLESLAQMFIEQNISGEVAEGGVYRGDFSCHINRVFPHKKLYLFDTFTGFNEDDIKIEYEKSYSDSRVQDHFSETSEELVIKKLPYPEQVIIKKGYFPDTAKGLEETFCFVNLDFDLYQPILAGLEYFYPRMVRGGVILIHDYFSNTYKGVKQAVFDFNTKVGGLSLIPIGDVFSIAIIKN